MGMSYDELYRKITEIEEYNNACDDSYSEMVEHVVNLARSYQDYMSDELGQAILHEIDTILTNYEKNTEWHIETKEVCQEVTTKELIWL